ncbi:GntR family transcriptional regulator [Desulfocurvus sp. DL9XJH121]
MAAKSKYVVIYEWLSQQIASKRYLPGDKLPGEVELAEQFGVHRMTVRQAINKLVNDHLVVRKRSQGTFLLSTERPVLTRSLGSISTYHDDIVKAGLKPCYKTLEAVIVPADDRVASLLCLAPGTDVVYLQRLMLASGVPLVLEQSYLPSALFPDLLTRPLETMLYRILSRDYGMSLKSSRTEIGAIIPSVQERKRLKIDQDCPCLWAEGVVFKEDGQPVEFSRALFRGDKYRFKCDIGRYVCEEIVQAAPPRDQAPQVETEARGRS